MMRLIAFDVDGTLCEVGARADFEDGHSLLRHTRPMPAAIERVRAFVRQGGQVRFVTARHRRLAEFTLAQLQCWIGDHVLREHVSLRDFDPYTPTDAALWKADVLRAMRPDLYVGDKPMDQTAAAIANVLFMPAEWWARGERAMRFAQVADANDRWDLVEAVA